MKTIYLVWGCSGGYEHEEWVVRAFLNKVQAERLAKKGNERVRALRDWRGADGETLGCTEDENHPKEPLVPFDTRVGKWDLDVEYTVGKVKLDEREHGPRAPSSKKAARS